MALSDLERRYCERDLDRFMKRRRPPPEIRSKLDLGWRFEGQSIVIFEIRPDWRDESVKYEVPVAKSTYIRSKDVWRVFWMRQDRKWHGYEPDYELPTLTDFLEVVDRDEHCCFFG